MNGSLFRFTSLIMGMALVLGGLLSAGCADRPSLRPNSDPHLRKTSAQFAADAAKRHPYKSDAPRGGLASARAQVGYTLNVLEIVNQSKEDWRDVEVWVNQQYVVFLPQMQPGVLKSIPFRMLYNDKGINFPLDNKTVLVNKVELLRDGTLYEVTLRLAD